MVSPSDFRRNRPDKRGLKVAPRRGPQDFGEMREAACHPVVPLKRSSAKSVRACHSPRSSNANGFWPTTYGWGVRSHLRKSASSLVIIRSRATRSKYPGASWSESASGVLLTACFVRPSQRASGVTLMPSSFATRTAERLPFASRKLAVAS